MDLLTKINFICTHAIKIIRFDQAIFFSMLQKLWQIPSGILSILMVAKFFSSETQGFYYTFASLIALQSFAELGLYIVISNVASHEWSRLKLTDRGAIEGDRIAFSRLISLGRFVFKWYAVASMGFLLIAGVGGYWFLGQSNVDSVDWKLPWLFHVLFSALILWTMPFLTLLEVCDQYPSVAKFRFWQSCLSSVVFWVVVLSGGGLWSACAVSACSAIFVMLYLFIGKINFFRPLLNPPEYEVINWRVEILPMQWRLAAQGLMSYFSFYIFTPILFHYYGPKVAGQMGMAQQIVMAILSVSTVWVMTSAPKYGQLIAKREFAILDIRWRNDCIISFVVMFGGIFVFLGIQFIMINMQWSYIDRLPPLLPMILLSAGSFFALGIQCIAFYLRAHKKEVLTPVGILSGALMGIMVWYFGSRYGLVGASASYLTVIAGIAFPFAAIKWFKYRNLWH